MHPMDESEVQKAMKEDFRKLVLKGTMTDAAEGIAKVARLNVAKTIGCATEMMIGIKSAQLACDAFMSGAMYMIGSDNLDKGWEEIRKMIPGTPEDVADSATSKRALCLMGIYQALASLKWVHADIMEFLVLVNSLPEGDFSCIASPEKLRKKTELRRENNKSLETIEGLARMVVEAIESETKTEPEKSTEELAKELSDAISKTKCSRDKGPDLTDLFKRRGLN